MTFDELAEKLNEHPSKAFGRGATEEEINAASALLGVPFKGDYRRFLRRFGWGGVGHWEVFGLGSDVPSHLNLSVLTQSERTEMHPRIPHHLLPFRNDGGGNHYCLDTRVPGEPPVVFWDHEAGEKQKPYRVADNFLSWLVAKFEAVDRS